ncbi:hypothetical protein CK503_12335 [Aliifodinibius salipaludis]|uniref:Nucleotidyltransferase n=1 Tax=Fodinibius salipaludis TaxID=2032627 RepID=A0A2A2G614_9BACT|nr:nucleotidyltransferase [Aliifodinibius salipaludis]PAU93206.1 hypothetical protein CK503_12335 [Aliifodinibius salipaludis]
MRLEEDYEEFIELLNEHKIQYLIVGAYAVSFYARPRNTGDIDFFIDNSSKNISNLLKVLQKFGFGELDLTSDDFEGNDNIIQLGYEPVRIDIMTGISGISFTQAYKNKVRGKLGNQPVYFISLDDLIINKRSSNRTQDMADAELLEKFQNKN